MKLPKLRKIEITPGVLSDHNVINLKLTANKHLVNTKTHADSTLNDKPVKEEIKKGIKTSWNQIKKNTQTSETH